MTRGYVADNTQRLDPFYTPNRVVDNWSSPWILVLHFNVGVNMCKQLEL